MADSSLVKRLGIKSGQQIIILNAPSGYIEQLGALPSNVDRADELDGSFNVVHLFVKNRAELAEYAPMAIPAVRPGGILWISYPKRSSKVVTDITRDNGWGVVHDAGLAGVAQIAIDEVWSALRFRPEVDVKRSRPRVST
jgi:hypothetical protein